MSKNISVRRYRSLSEIDADLWDSVNVENSFFKSHKFLYLQEKAKVESGIFWYLLFYEDDHLVGACAISSFLISLDLFLDSRSQKAITVVRFLFQGFMKIRILFCGTPLSIGKNSLLIAKPELGADILDCLLVEMDRICSEQKINYVSLKEFSEEETHWLDRVMEAGYIKCPSLPYVSMPVNWDSFTDYLSSLRHTYRRQIMASLNKVDFGELLPFPSRKHVRPQKPIIDYSSDHTCDPQRFYEMYLSVMDRAEVKLEVLNQEFFNLLCNGMHSEIRMIIIRQKNEVLASALLVQDQDSLVFLLVGLDYEKRDLHDVYFNLIYAILAYAIENKVKRLDLGQTSYYVKQRIGGTCTPMYFYLRSRNRLVNWMLRKFQKTLFPETELSHHRVFRR
ncbi:MAG: GNAT family N-acetyltransferase [Bacteroidota bacterium]